MSRVVFFVIPVSMALITTALAASGDPIHGAAVFQSCASCHSIAPGEHMTGPSLAHVWNRPAASVEDFDRYSEALKHADIVWTDANLDRWLSAPDKLVPGTAMAFPGLHRKKDRDDVVAYLKAASEGNAAKPTMRGGMMSGPSKPNLKQAPPRGQVTAIEHCRDTYTIKTAAGTTDKVWEFNVRLKTDSSNNGPLPGKPVVVGSGMQGDRVSVIFSAPSEISRLIKECQ